MPWTRLCIFDANRFAEGVPPVQQVGDDYAFAFLRRKLLRQQALADAALDARDLCLELVNQACRQGFSARYLRMPKFNEEMAIAHGSGGYAKLLAQWAKTDILVMDDLAMAPLSDSARRDLLEVLDDRHGRRSTIVTSQIPVDSWHAAIGDPTLADAILDRLVHNAHRLTLSGESMRKRRNGLTIEDEKE
ncbi:DNA replication protein DnaC [Paraburkholderia sp. JPY465]